MIEEEKEEIREIYRNKGFKEDILEDLVKSINFKKKGMDRYHDERRISTCK